jgi:hypothetical protein
VTATGKRGLVLGLALLATLFLVWKTSHDKQNDGADVIEPVSHAAKAPTNTGVLPAAKVEAPKAVVARWDEDTAGDPFAPMTWFVEPKIQPPPPPPPVVPPIPFMFYGKVTGEAGLQAVLQMDEETIVAKAGDIVQSNYRVDAIEGDKLNLTYLPLNRKQVLVMGKAAEPMPEMAGGIPGVPPGFPGANGVEMTLSGRKVLPGLPRSLPAANE